LLHRIDVLRNPSDLDLLVFFARHPLALLATEQLAVLLGYEFTQIATSLDVLQRVGLLNVSENPAFIARKYAFSQGGQNSEWVPDLLQIASTRDGRLALVQALKERAAGETGSAATGADRSPTADAGRPTSHRGPAKRKAASQRASHKRRKGKAR
jgi:hypothetical protein